MSYRFSFLPALAHFRSSENSPVRTLGGSDRKHVFADTRSVLLSMSANTLAAKRVFGLSRLIEKYTSAHTGIFFNHLLGLDRIRNFARMKSARAIKNELASCTRLRDEPCSACQLIFFQECGIVRIQAPGPRFPAVQPKRKPLPWEPFPTGSGFESQYSKSYFM